MALTGSQLDLAARMYAPEIALELQQMGSYWRNLVDEERAEGDRILFSKLGAAQGTRQITSRLMDREYSDYTAERRVIFPIPLEYATAIDKFDEVRFLSSPQQNIVKSAAMELGRQMDDIVIAAIGGTASLEVGGASSSEVFDTTNQQIVDTDNSFAFTSLASASTPLNEGKLIHAKNILATNFVDVGAEEIYVVGNARQFHLLLSRLGTLNQARRDFLDKAPLTIPGVDSALGGFLGMTYVRSERIPQISSKDVVYVFPKSAMKLAVWQDIATRVFIDEKKALSPVAVACNMIVGATRMYKQKVVQILCATS